MSILENCDEMFFGRTEKSGDKLLVNRRTENGKELCNIKRVEKCFFEILKTPIPFFGYVLAT
jgi:hypothetical protein